MKEHGMFGDFGGLFAPEPLMPALEELEEAFIFCRQDMAFLDELKDLQKHYAGRPTPLYHAENLSIEYGANIFLKREDLLHGGAHKTNNALGQGLLAAFMGKKRLIAETGAGQHGVAVAMVAALLGMEAVIYMGADDVARQYQNVLRMKLLGATVHPVTEGSRTLKDAINAALRDWVTNVRTTHYLIGTAAGPHPFPSMVRFFQRIIGDEAREQFLEGTGVLPDCVVACVGGGSNAIGMFSAFIDDKQVELVGVEPAGEGLDKRHGAVLSRGTDGCLHGMLSKVLQDSDGQIQPTHSIAAGLDYPSVGPEHAHLAKIGRARYESATDAEAINAFVELSRREGIIPALESSHAVAAATRLGATGKYKNIVVCLSGRGDKDLNQVMPLLDLESQSSDELCAFGARGGRAVRCPAVSTTTSEFISSTSSESLSSRATHGVAPTPETGTDSIAPIPENECRGDAMRRPEQRERIENAERELEENVAGARTARPPREQRSRGQAKSTIESRSPSNNRYAARFQQRPKAFIPFTLLGFPNQATSISIIKTMIDAGAHSLELGIAFSDPIADGPTIQQAAHEVIDSGFTTADALDVCAEVRSYSPDVPMSLLVYSNTIRAYGEENFCHDAALAGVDGITIVDLPPESAEHFVATARRYNLACVFLVSPVSSPARVEKIMQLTDGYHYMLSRLGITGSIERYDDVLSEKIFELKSLSSLPVCIGFGISKPEQAKRMIEMGADGVITGSAILELCRSTNFCLESLAEYVSSMATGLGAQPQSQPDFACLSAR